MSADKAAELNELIEDELASEVAAASEVAERPRQQLSLELRQHEVGVNDLFVLRTEAALSLESIEAFHQAIEKVQPEWRGALFVIGADTTLERLDDETQLALFNHLSKRFSS